MRASSAITATLALVLLATSGAQPDSPDQRHDDKAIGIQQGLRGAVLFTWGSSNIFRAVFWQVVTGRWVLFADAHRRVPSRWRCAISALKAIGCSLHAEGFISGCRMSQYFVVVWDCT